MDLNDSIESMTRKTVLLDSYVFASCVAVDRLEMTLVLDSLEQEKRMKDEIEIENSQVILLCNFLD
jgi:hypothetical protein